MSINKTLAICAAVASLHCVAATAQTTNNAASPNLFRVVFRATERGLSTNGTNLVNTRINNTNILGAFVGTNSTIASTNLNKVFALVYDTTHDAIQIVNATNGQFITNVIEFGGVASAADSVERARFAFMFIPGQTNAFGSAVIDELGVRSVTGTTNDHANISGTIQYVLTGGALLGSTNVLSTNSAVTGTSGVVATNVLGTTVVVGVSTNFFMTSAFDDPTAKIGTGFFFTDGRLVRL
jgi:hypothetical protein